jgi:predicted GNAT family N-acyltransferase
MPEAWRIERAYWLQHRAQLLHIRFRVFVDEQGVPRDMEEDEHDPHALHLLVRDAQGQPIGCARLLHSGQIGRMAVLQAYRCQGIGSRLLQQLLQLAGQTGLPRVFLHAQCQAEGFYRRAGFTPVGEVFMEAGISHREMHLSLRPADPA